ncbi:MAG: hypothetical protein AAF585_13330, partial [Verrucomicrobiota bacterium]
GQVQSYAATAASGGSFMGFPGLIYTHGWSLGWWICGYMITPLIALGFMAKRLNQVGRIAGAITVPELLLKRFDNKRVGITATLIVVFFMFFYLLAQFKGGAKIMATLLSEHAGFLSLSAAVDRGTDGIPWIGAAEGGYIICLVLFSIAVVVYTAYGGFRAVVWTDVMQGLVMGAGVVIMLFLAIHQVGGLGNATAKIAEMTPPESGWARVKISAAAEEKLTIPKATWIKTQNDDVIRLKKTVTIEAQSLESALTEVLIITTPSEIEATKKLASPNLSAALLRDQARIVLSEVTENQLTFEAGALISDGEESIFQLPKNIQVDRDQSKSEEFEASPIQEPNQAQKLLGQPREGIEIENLSPNEYEFGAGQPGVYLTTPGPHPSKAQGFLPVFLALSFFAFWNFAGAGQPSYMVRQMAFKDSVVLRRSIIFVGIFFTLIYLPLVIIFTCARVLIPGWEIDADRIMPEMAAALTANAGVPWLAGLLVAAPFAAIMSSVDSFLLLVSSGVVRDIYQQNYNPNASDKILKRLSHLVTLALGVFSVIAVLNPPQFLQDLIVFASAGIGACFLMPMAMALYWPRMTANGCIAGMLSGALTILVFYIIGFAVNGKFSEYNLLGFHPFIWSIGVTSGMIWSVSRSDKEPDEKLVEKYFGR